MKKKPWWQWILIVDLFLVVITTLHKYPIRFPGKWAISYPFNLANEMNLATWWSGIILFAVGLLCYEIYCRIRDKARRAWLILATVFAGLSLDEIGSIHERMGGFSKLLPLAAILAVLLIFALLSLYIDPQTRPSSIFIGSGFVLFALVALQEYIEHAISFPAWAKGIRVGIEEGTELAGSLLALYGSALVRNRVVTSGTSALPNIPAERLPWLVSVGFVLHAAAAMTIPQVVDITVGGNPLTWYPSAMCFLLACFCYSCSKTKPYEDNRVWLICAWAMVVLSALTVFRPIGYFALILSSVTNEFVDMVYLSLGIAMAILMMIRFKTGRTSCCLAVLSMSSLLLVMYIIVESQVLFYLNSGVVVVCIYNFIITNFKMLKIDGKQNVVIHIDDEVLK